MVRCRLDKREVFCEGKTPHFCNVSQTQRHNTYNYDNVKKAQKRGKIRRIAVKNNKLLSKLQKIKLVIHPLFLLLGVVLFAVGLGKLFIIYTLCAVLHEGAHALVARKLGYVCARVKLMPYGAVLEAESDEFVPRDEIIIALVGPLSNLLFALVCVCAWWIFPESYYLTSDFVVANMSCALFNLLPIFPLDGGRVVLSFFSKNHDRKFAVKVVKIVTIIFSILLFILFVVVAFFSVNFSIGIISILLMASAFSEDKNTSFKRIISMPIKRKKLLHGLPVNFVMVDQNMSLTKVLSKLSFNHYNYVLICDDNFEILSKLSESELERALQFVSPLMSISVVAQEVKKAAVTADVEYC